MMEKVRTIAGILALLWMCVIFAFSAQQEEESSEVSEAFSYRIVSSTGRFFHLNLDDEEVRRIANVIEGAVRKAAHMTEFGILSVLIYIWLGKWEITVKNRMVIAAVLTMLYAASDEFHQLFVPGRAGRIVDVLIDSMGAILGVVIFVGVKKCISFLWNRRKSRDIKLS